MPKLLLILIIACIIINSGCVIPTYLGKSTLNETEVNKSDSKITSVLLVGVGSTPSRVFLESLSPEIIKLFGRYHIKCEYTYEGKIPRRSHVNLNKIINTKYDAYLVFNPIDTSYLDTHKSVASVAMPLPGGYSASGSLKGNQYVEEYYIELYTNNNSLNKVWQAELKVDFDLANPGRHQKIAKEIFDKLVKNGIISNN